MHELSTDALLRCFPMVFADDASLQALASAIAEVLMLRQEETELAKVYPDLDDEEHPLPETVLDALAQDFKVDWWDSGLTHLQKQRALVASWDVHRRMGTPKAVKDAVSAVCPGAEVEEWFEYAGIPGHFRILLPPDFDAHTADETIAAVIRAVSYVKRFSAWLDCLRIGCENAVTAYTGFAVRTWRRTSVGCDIPEDFDLEYLGDEEGAILRDEIGNTFIDA